MAAYASTVNYSGITLGVPPNLLGILNVNSTLTQVSPAVPVLTLDGSGEMGDFIDPTLSGLPGSGYLLMFSTRFSLLPVATLYTDLFLHTSTLRYPFIGALPPEGFITHSMRIPSNQKLLGRAVFFQAYLETPLGEPYLSTAAAFVIQ